ncbi:sulfatase [Acidobacteria bacterium AH-259-O06]|nr:sulfatase [Acidobacteria bacterium AH-259-O06]
MYRNNSARPGFLKAIGLGAATLVMAGCYQAGTVPEAKKPNLIIIFADDLGYNDLGVFGSPLIETPRLDQMTKEGMKFTSFYTQAVCGPSRAAIMTGCYPVRVAEPDNVKNQHTVLHPDEITLAETLKASGYATACLGKWHLAGAGEGPSPGEGPFPPQLMPNAQGFDYFYGTPLFNGYTKYNEQTGFRCQLMRNSEVLEEDADLDTLTQKYTSEAIKYILEHKDRPFFLYLAHNMPHVPLGASEKFKGQSKRGLYGDAVEELDWSTGQILDTLKEQGLDDDTLVVFTSDNGPWIEGVIGDHGGSADPLRGAKMMTWEGGLHVPCIMRWPGKIPANQVCDEVATTMDLLPTFAKLADVNLPADRVMDGKDIWPLMMGQKNATSPHEVFYYYAYTHLQAVRSGRWKLVLPRPARPPWTGWSARMIDQILKPQLYDLQLDIGEHLDVAGEHADIVVRLMKLAEKAREDLGDYNRIGKGARFFDDAPPRPDIWKKEQKQER